MKTIRRLFALSGNRCAFRGCDHSLIDQYDNFVGQICHIHDAKPNKVGEPDRFCPAMTNEERRAPENLLLMCYQHHVETNDVERFSPERMRRIKAEHEAQFADPAATQFDAPQEVVEALSTFPSMEDLAERLTAELNESAWQYMRYEPDKDVRSPKWPGQAMQVVISGQSGAGKSWYLAALANSLVKQGKLVTLHSMRALLQAADVFSEAAVLIANVAADSTHHRPLPAVDKLLQHCAGHAIERFLLVDAVDNTPTARKLLNGNRNPTAIVVPDIVFEELRKRRPQDAERQYVQVLDFTPTQRQAYLAQHGVFTRQLPFQLLELLRRPFFAGVFVERFAANRPNPETAHELLAEYWQTNGASIRWGEILDGLCDLSRRAVLGDTPYPFERRKIREALGTPALTELTGRGFVVRNGQAFVLAHDLHLSWLAAQALSNTHIGEREADLLAVAGYLAPRYEGQHKKLVARVENLGSDTIAASLAADDLEQLVQVIHALAAKGHPQQKARHTLRDYGADILPAYRRYIEQCDENGEEFAHVGTEHLVNPGGIAWAVQVLASSSSKSARRFALQLLGRDGAGCCMTTEIAAAAMTCLADTLQALVEADRSARAQVWAALRETVAGCPCVLADAQADQVLSTADLLNLASSLRGEEGRLVWLSIKEELEPQDGWKRRCFGRAVTALLDETELPRMRLWLANSAEWATSDDEYEPIFNAEVFAEACIALGDDPIDTLEQVPTKLLRNLGNSIRFALIRCPGRAEAFLRRRFAEADEKKQLSYWSNLGNFLPESLLADLLSGSGLEFPSTWILERAHSAASVKALKTHQYLFDEIEAHGIDFRVVEGQRHLALRAASSAGDCGYRVVQAAITHSESAWSCLHSDLAGIFLSHVDASDLRQKTLEDSGQWLAANFALMGAPDLALEVVRDFRLEGFQEYAETFLRAQPPTECEAVGWAEQVIEQCDGSEKDDETGAALIVLGLSGLRRLVPLLLSIRFEPRSTRSMHLWALRCLARGPMGNEVLDNLQDQLETHTGLVVDVLWEEHSDTSLNRLAARLNHPDRPERGTLEESAWLFDLGEKVDRARADYLGFRHIGYRSVPRDKASLLRELEGSHQHNSAPAQSIAWHLWKLDEDAAYECVLTRRDEPSFAYWARGFLFQVDWRKALAFFADEYGPLDEGDARQVGLALDQVVHRDQVSQELSVVWNRPERRRRLVAFLAWQTDTVGGELLDLALSDFALRSEAMTALVRRASAQIAMQLLEGLTGQCPAHDWGYVDAFIKVCRPKMRETYLDGAHILRRTQTVVHPVLRNMLNKGLKAR